MHGRASLLITSAVLLLTFGLWLPLGGPASGSYADQTSEPIAVGATASPRAECRDGVAVAGGFFSEGLDLTRNSELSSFDSAPAGRDGFRVGTTNRAGRPESVTAEALCERSKGRWRKAGAAVPAGGTADARASCHRGETATAGGFSAPGFAVGGPEVFAFESIRKGSRAWKARAYEDSGAAPGRIVAHVFCVPGTVRLRVVSELGDRFNRKTIDLKPNCPQGMKLYGGGFQGPRASGGPTPFMLPDRHSPDGHGWRTRFLGKQSPAGEVIAYSYCGPK